MFTLVSLTRTKIKFYLYIYYLHLPNLCTGTLLCTRTHHTTYTCTSILKFSRSVVSLAFLFHTRKPPPTTDEEHHQKNDHASTKHYSNSEHLIALLCADQTHIIQRPSEQENKAIQKKRKASETNVVSLPQQIQTVLCTHV